MNWTAPKREERRGGRAQHNDNDSTNQRLFRCRCDASMRLSKDIGRLFFSQQRTVRAKRGGSVKYERVSQLEKTADILRPSQHKHTASKEECGRTEKEKEKESIKMLINTRQTSLSVSGSTILMGGWHWRWRWEASVRVLLSFQSRTRMETQYVR